METLDDILRYGAASMLAWVAVLMWRNFCDRLAGQLGALSAASSAVYLIGSKSDFMLFGVEGFMVLAPISSISVILTWLFCLSQFDDSFKPKFVHKLVFTIKLLAGIAIYPALALGFESLVGPLAAFSRVIIWGVVFHLIVVTWQGRHDDLVESRRKFRSVFTISVIVVSIVILLSESRVQDHEYSLYMSVLQAIGFWAIAFFILWRMASPDAIDLFFVVPQSGETPKTGAADEHCALSPTDQHDLNTIVAFTNTDNIFETGLTITRLAQQTQVPEHRLRHLINQHMGYRNFADFVNFHRVEVAKKKLGNMQYRKTPVLTLAMDLGYGSLGPFNRAFKERTGLTPTEFRIQSMEADLVAAK